jgi:predicted RNA-binding Zn-ribbon protein involved in translation (DUF1610 family)
VTLNLSHADRSLRRAMSKQIETETEMNDHSCPWCEADLILHLLSDEQTCPECGTTWSYDEDETGELPLAA